jgi:hypothetical protein
MLNQEVNSSAVNWNDFGLVTSVKNNMTSPQVGDKVVGFKDCVWERDQYGAMVWMPTCPISRQITEQIRKNMRDWLDAQLEADFDREFEAYWQDYLKTVKKTSRKRSTLKKTD